MAQKTSAHKKAKYQQYRSEHREMKNKISRVTKHLKRHGQDSVAIEFLNLSWIHHNNHKKNVATTCRPFTQLALKVSSTASPSGWRSILLCNALSTTSLNALIKLTFVKMNVGEEVYLFRDGKGYPATIMAFLGDFAEVQYQDKQQTYTTKAHVSQLVPKIKNVKVTYPKKDECDNEA